MPSDISHRLRRAQLTSRNSLGRVDKSASILMIQPTGCLSRWVVLMSDSLLLLLCVHCCCYRGALSR